MAPLMAAATHLSLLQRTGDRVWEAPDKSEGGMGLRQGKKNLLSLVQKEVRSPEN